GTEDMSNSEPSKRLRIIIAFVIAFFALTLLAIGGLEPLEVVSGFMGIPVIIVQFFTIYAAFKMMNEDKAWIYNIREKDKSRSKRDKRKLLSFKFLYKTKTINKNYDDSNYKHTYQLSIFIFLR